MRGSSASLLAIFVVNSLFVNSTIFASPKDYSCLCFKNKTLTSIHNYLSPKYEKPYKDENGRTLLHLSVIKDDIRFVDLLIARGLCVNSKDKWMCCPLHYAQSPDMVQLLVETGADIDVKNIRGCTPLYEAVRAEKLEVVRELLRQGANPNIKNFSGKSPLALAVEKYQRDIADILAFYGAQVESIYEAAYVGDLDKLRKCLGNGLDVNSPAPDGSTALHKAAHAGRIKIVKFLLKKGANPNCRDKTGLTPLHLTSDEKVAKMLIEAGAKPNSKDKTGMTPLHYAALNGRSQVIRVLLECGANINSKDESGMTPIFLAGDYRVAELLIEKGVNLLKLTD